MKGYLTHERGSADGSTGGSDLLNKQYAWRVRSVSEDFCELLPVTLLQSGKAVRVGALSRGKRELRHVLVFSPSVFSFGARQPGSLKHPATALLSREYFAALRRGERTSDAIEYALFGVCGQFSDLFNNDEESSMSESSGDGEMVEEAYGEAAPPSERDRAARGVPPPKKPARERGRGGKGKAATDREGASPPEPIVKPPSTTASDNCAPAQSLIMRAQATLHSVQLAQRWRMVSIVHDLLLRRSIAARWAGEWLLADDAVEDLIERIWLRTTLTVSTISSGDDLSSSQRRTFRAVSPSRSPVVSPRVGRGQSQRLLSDAGKRFGKGVPTTGVARVSLLSRKGSDFRSAAHREGSGEQQQEARLVSFALGRSARQRRATAHGLTAGMQQRSAAGSVGWEAASGGPLMTPLQYVYLHLRIAHVLLPYFMHDDVRLLDSFVADLRTEAAFEGSANPITTVPLPSRYPRAEATFSSLVTDSSSRRGSGSQLRHGSSSVDSGPPLSTPYERNQGELTATPPLPLVDVDALGLLAEVPRVSGLATSSMSLTDDATSDGSSALSDSETERESSVVDRKVTKVGSSKFDRMYYRWPSEKVPQTVADEAERKVSLPAVSDLTRVEADPLPPQVTTAHPPKDCPETEAERPLPTGEHGGSSVTKDVIPPSSITSAGKSLSTTAAFVSTSPSTERESAQVVGSELVMGDGKPEAVEVVGTLSAVAGTSESASPQESGDANPNVMSLETILAPLLALPEGIDFNSLEELAQGESGSEQSSYVSDLLQLPSLTFRQFRRAMLQLVDTWTTSKHPTESALFLAELYCDIFAHDWDEEDEQVLAALRQQAEALALARREAQLAEQRERLLSYNKDGADQEISGSDSGARHRRKKDREGSVSSGRAKSGRRESPGSVARDRSSDRSRASLKEQVGVDGDGDWDQLGGRRRATTPDGDERRSDRSAAGKGGSSRRARRLRAGGRRYTSSSMESWSSLSESDAGSHGSVASDEWDWGSEDERWKKLSPEEQAAHREVRERRRMHRLKRRRRSRSLSSHGGKRYITYSNRPASYREDTRSSWCKRRKSLGRRRSRRNTMTPDGRYRRGARQRTFSGTLLPPPAKYADSIYFSDYTTGSSSSFGGSSGSYGSDSNSGSAAHGDRQHRKRPHRATDTGHRRRGRRHLRSRRHRMRAAKRSSAMSSDESGSYSTSYVFSDEESGYTSHDFSLDGMPLGELEEEAALLHFLESKGLSLEELQSSDLLRQLLHGGDGTDDSDGETMRRENAILALIGTMRRGSVSREERKKQLLKWLRKHHERQSEETILQEPSPVTSYSVGQEGRQPSSATWASRVATCIDAEASGMTQRPFRDDAVERRYLAAFALLRPFWERLREHRRNRNVPLQYSLGGFGTGGAGAGRGGSSILSDDSEETRCLRARYGRYIPPLRRFRAADAADESMRRLRVAKTLLGVRQSPKAADAAPFWRELPREGPTVRSAPQWNGDDGPRQRSRANRADAGAVWFEAKSAPLKSNGSTAEANDTATYGCELRAPFNSGPSDCTKKELNYTALTPAAAVVASSERLQQTLREMQGQLNEELDALVQMAAASRNACGARLSVGPVPGMAPNGSRRSVSSPPHVDTHRIGRSMGGAAARTNDHHGYSPHERAGEVHGGSSAASSTYPGLNGDAVARCSTQQMVLPSASQCTLSQALTEERLQYLREKVTRVARAPRP